MPTIEERIADIEAELTKTKYNKATASHFATLRAKLSRLRSEQIENVQRAKSTGSSAGFGIKKHGDATVILLGWPSVGKSTLLNAITNQESKVAAYDFTTLDAIPGMMNYTGKYAGTNIQIIDLPGIIEEAAHGKGRGRQVFSSVRNSDLILILIDATRPYAHLDIIKNELYVANVRINQHPRNIRILKRDRGGINVTGINAKMEYGAEEVRNILREYRINSADVFINDFDASLEDVIDAVAGNRLFVPALIAMNKVDLIPREALKEMKERIGSFVPISAEKKWNLEALKEEIANAIRLMRIYLRRPGQKADMEEPMIIKLGSTIEDLSRKIHKRFIDDFRFASVWGRSAKYPGQKVGLDHVLEDSDVVKIVLKK
ncbi:MAG TPA: GTP-binding protein [Candidatus Hodarchaeales archaeon]|nr:GTP-binding protein [Candidatus Hodarchaeales archaeon]